MLNLKADFPIFQHHPNLVYLDSAATSQKPAAVIDGIAEFYRTSNANIHRGLYPLSVKSTEQYELARLRVTKFIDAFSEKEVIFTRSATEGINLLASSLSRQWKPGDSVILSELEHHSNLVPWQILAQNQGIQLKFIRITPDGQINLQHLATLLDERTRLVSLTHCSNVLGTITNIQKAAELTHTHKALLLVDASQSIAHYPISVQELGCDFLVFSGHKVYGPSGIGVLWGRENLLEKLPPYQTGGDMIKTVTPDHSTWNDLPWKFEAGTPNIEGAVGLGLALEYLRCVGMERIAEHTAELSRYALEEFEGYTELSVLGKPDSQSGIISFILPSIHAHDIANLLGEQEICIRAGHHCTAPLHAQLNLVASNRISFGLYSSLEDLDRFFTALNEVISAFQS